MRVIPTAAGLLPVSKPYLHGRDKANRVVGAHDLKEPFRGGRGLQWHASGEGYMGC